ncbi:DnaB-like helicase N-terminal domain-containing protein, partial [Plasticicumulans acidivorans]
MLVDTDALRIPPHSNEAEQAVLGGLLLDNAAWDHVADRVGEEDFYRADHRLIFRAVKLLAEKGSPLDVVTLSEWLASHDLLDDAGGLPYLARLARDTPSAANIRAYADIVRERSVLRQLIRVGTDIAARAFAPEGRDSKELLDEAERQVFAIAEQGNRQNQGFQPIKDLLTKAIDRIDTLFERDDPITGVPTGWNDFDEMTAGLQAGDLIIIAGRP